MPGVHGNHSPRSTRSSQFNSIQTVEIPDDVKEQRRDVDEAVDPVQDSPVAGNGRAQVFDTQVSLDHTDGQVTQLAPDADDRSDQDAVPRLEVRKGAMHRP